MFATNTTLTALLFYFSFTTHPMEPSLISSSVFFVEQWIPTVLPTSVDINRVQYTPPFVVFHYRAILIRSKGMIKANLVIVAFNWVTEMNHRLTWGSYWIKQFPYFQMNTYLRLVPSIQLIFPPFSRITSLVNIGLCKKVCDKKHLRMALGWITFSKKRCWNETSKQRIRGVGVNRVWVWD